MAKERSSMGSGGRGSRSLGKIVRQYGIVVIGGGLAGIAAAISAARRGIKTALVHDRPCLGGNASKEIRVNPAGAQGNANAVYFRETGLTEELMLENRRYNQEGIADLWDLTMLDKVLAEKNIDLYLNAGVFKVEMDPLDPGRINSVTALVQQSESLVTCRGDYFIDCTGDGTVGFLAGAPFMRGHESGKDFGESLAGERRSDITMGGSLLFRARNMGRPVEFHRPAFAYKFTKKDFRAHRNPVFNPEAETNCGYWWIEWGGVRDTVRDNEAIVLKLKKTVCGVIDYLKNDPELREEHRNFAIEWIGCMPGKRESRRFVGDHILTQNDIEKRLKFADAVAYGGWNLDDHAPLGFFDDRHTPSFHTQIPGIYNIPLRCLYSKKVGNLFFAGRDISVTHVALTSTRVILTCAQEGEAAGAAAAMCLRRRMSPRQLAGSPAVRELQQDLLKDDHHIVGVKCSDPADLAMRKGVKVKVSSQRSGIYCEHADILERLDVSKMVLFSAEKGKLPYVEVLLDVKKDAVLRWRLHRADGTGLTIPRETVTSGRIGVKRGPFQWVRVPLNATISRQDWHMFEICRSPHVFWHAAEARTPGAFSFFEMAQELAWGRNLHSRFACMRGWGGWAAEEFKMCCIRFPADKRIFSPGNVVNGWLRPHTAPNMWVSDDTDFSKPETLELRWPVNITIRQIRLLFDSSLETLLCAFDKMKSAVIPDLVKDYDIEIRFAGQWKKVASVNDNFLRHRIHTFRRPLKTNGVRLTVRAANGVPHARVYEIRVY